MSIKEQARILVESLSEDSTWEDLMYEIYVRESVERGLEDVRAGRVKTWLVIPNFMLDNLLINWLREQTYLVISR
jgi:hypothetical protein